jgi:hypothetical protein
VLATLLFNISDCCAKLMSDNTHWHDSVPPAKVAGSSTAARVPLFVLLEFLT